MCQYSQALRDFTLRLKRASGLESSLRRRSVLMALRAGADSDYWATPAPGPLECSLALRRRDAIARGPREFVWYRKKYKPPQEAAEGEKPCPAQPMS